VSEALGDQPLPAAGLGLAHLPAETGVAGGLRMIRDELVKRRSKLTPYRLAILTP
jgi:hypothetical protein